MNRPQQRNAVNQDMAQQLTVAFQAFENDKNSNVAVLHGKGKLKNKLVLLLLNRFDVLCKKF